MDNELYLMRGCAGCGKSTLAREMRERNLSLTVVLSADHAFYDDSLGHYLWSANGLYHAHKLCQIKTENAMKQKLDVIVDNTNLTQKEIWPYILLAEAYNYTVYLIEPTTEWANNPEECYKRNTHRVPLEAIENMLKRKQDSKTIIENIKQIKPDLEIELGK
jgi:predicted kinase